MSEPLTLDGELSRQLKLVRRGEASSVVCPFCGRISTAETGDCCNDMTEARERIAQEAMASLQRQFNGVRSGVRDSVQCPFCDEINRWENVSPQASPAEWKRPNVNPYCCDSMFAAVLRLGDHKVVQDQIDHARRIQDNIAKVSRN